MNFCVELDLFHGPLDLLLYLVRKQELDVVDLPIAPIMGQYLEYLEILQEIDLDQVGDFLEVASILAEIKSRLVLPQGGEVEEEETLADPREDLVRQLLAYKQFKEAAAQLEERCRQWQDRFPRLSRPLTVRPRDPADEPLVDLELWDLVSAFGRIMKAHRAAPQAKIVYDETPIRVFMQRVHERLWAERTVPFAAFFTVGMQKSTLVGIFLAILELIRHHGVLARQDEVFGEITILVGPQTHPTLDLALVDDYESQGDEEESSPASPAPLAAVKGTGGPP